MNRIDFRSDTVTEPTPKMREAMANAPVGDDVYGEDPTVNRLEALAAQKLGKEAGLFVVSGTMGNVVALLTHCGRGDRAIIGDKAHIHVYEAGNPAALGGVQPYTLPVQADGTLRLADIEAAIPDASNVHFPYARVVALENTQANTGGQVLTAAYIQQVGALCHERGLALHIDGARIFNASSASATPAHELVAAADSVSVCLSKGLCAPVGSVLVGSHEFIARARRVRKQVGGGMRQAGILAAAGIIALEEMTERLSEDHVNAKRLAEGLADIPCIQIDPARVATNLVFFQLHPDAKLNAKGLAEALRADNIWLNPGGTYAFRAVTHYWIRPEHVELLLARVRHYLS